MTCNKGNHNYQMTQIQLARQGPEMLITGMCIFTFPFCARSCVLCKASVLPHTFQKVPTVGRKCWWWEGF